LHRDLWKMFSSSSWSPANVWRSFSPSSFCWPTPKSDSQTARKTQEK
jgi:hypothetical protein